MKLTCYVMDQGPLDIRPAGLSRDWMENSTQRYAYRCLPLNIANTHGWEICCDESFEAEWNGKPGRNDIRVSKNSIARSHFGEGVLTFHVKCVFRTEPEWNLMVMGPPNRPKRGIQALTGVIETDWSPYGFTMNWIFTESEHRVTFMKGEPYCFFFPVPRGAIESVEPAFCDMQSDPDLYLEHAVWQKSRLEFLVDLSEPGSEAAQEKWQRRYFHGQRMDERPGAPTHESRIRAKPFAPIAPAPVPPGELGTVEKRT